MLKPEFGRLGGFYKRFRRRSFSAAGFIFQLTDQSLLCEAQVVT
jgi:hypothetical protein